MSEITHPIVVYAAISEELDYQTRKHGSITDNPHTVGEWLLIVEAELAEAKHAWLKAGDADALRELLQVASVAVACMTQHGVVPRQALRLGRGDERQEAKP